MRRVAVTGMGVVSSIGCDLDSFRTCLFAGRSGIREIDTPDAAKLRFRNGAQIAGLSVNSHFDSKQISLLDAFTQYGLVAAREAMRQSGLTPVPHRTCVITGTGGGGQQTTDEGFLQLYGHNSPRVNPLTIPRIMSSACASHISMEFGITGPVYTVSTACSSSNHAIGQAFHMIRSGICDTAITGGSEAMFSYGSLKSWEAMRVVAPDTCRPFSKDRKGMILGEGAGILVLEEMQSAIARGASIAGEIAGFGMSSDAHHITQPSADGAAQAIQAALKDAGVEPSAIAYINAHGTGTTANDAAETRAIRLALGDHANRVVVSSTKSMHGHALGAAGAIEAVATVLALQSRTAPPTANYTEPDPECDLNVTPNRAQTFEGDWSLSNSFAFGGLNAVLVFRATP